MFWILVIIAVPAAILTFARIAQSARTGHTEEQARVMTLLQRTAYRNREPEADADEPIAPDAREAVAAPAGADTTDAPRAHVRVEPRGPSRTRRTAAFMRRHWVATTVATVATTVALALQLGWIVLPAFAFSLSWPSWSWGNPIGWATDPANRQWFITSIGAWVSLLFTVPYTCLVALTESMGFQPDGFTVAMVGIVVLLGGGYILQPVRSWRHRRSMRRNPEAGYTLVGVLILITLVFGAVVLVGQTGFFDGIMLTLKSEAENIGSVAKIHGLQRHLDAQTTLHEHRETIRETANVYDDKGVTRKDSAGQPIQLEPQTKVFVVLMQERPSTLGLRAQKLVCPIIDHDECDMSRSGWVYASLVDGPIVPLFPDKAESDTGTKTGSTASLSPTPPLHSGTTHVETATTLANLGRDEVRTITLTRDAGPTAFCITKPACIDFPGYLPSWDRRGYQFIFPDDHQARPILVDGDGSHDYVNERTVQGRMCIVQRPDDAAPQTLDVWLRGGTTVPCARPG